VLQRALHGGGEVAAVGGSLGAWRGRERASAKPKSGGGGPAQRVDCQREQEVDRGRPRAAGGRRTALAAVRSRASRRKGKKGQFAISNNSRDQNVKTTITFNIGLKCKSAQHESCSIFQDLQL
jgi:hypothetical protein